MGLKLLAQAQANAAPLRAVLNALQARLDGLLAPAEAMPGEAPKQGGLPVWAIILIVIGAIICIVPLCIVVVIAILTLLGPSIGNVFSGVITDI